MRHGFDEHLTAEGLSESTIRAYHGAIRRAYAAGLDLETCTALELAAYVRTHVPNSASSRRHFRTALVRYWEMIGRIDGPVRAVPVPAKKRGVCRALDHGDARLLFAAAKDHPPPMSTAVYLGLFLALRREEIAKARWDGFDHRFEWYTFVGKRSITATLPVHPKLRRHLLELDRSAYVYLFPGARRRAFAHPFTIANWIQHVADHAGIGPVKPHELRHTAIADVNDKTGDLRAASVFARHARVETTMLYTRTTVAKLRAAVESLDWG